MENGLLRTSRVSRNRSFRYLAGRLLTLAVTVVIGTYITLIIANLGGYADQTVRHGIDQVLDARLLGGWLRDETPDDRLRIFNETAEAMYEAAGLNQPFLLRTFRWLGRGLTLNWGRTSAGFLYGQPAMSVQDVILLALPRTLLLFGTSNLLLFLISVAIGLSISRKPDGLASRVFAILTPLSSVPPWAYAFILMYIAITVFGIYWGRTNISWPQDMNSPWEWSFLFKQLAIPFLALLLSKIFQSIYVWQTIFVLYGDENYVELARAKGLPPRLVERQYLVRPALPVILTSFAMVMLGIWQESIPLEFFFNISGIGRLLLHAINRVDIGILLGLVVTFTYLLALTVILLDVARVLIDPRARVEQQRDIRAAGPSRRGRRRGFRPAGPRPRPAMPRLLPDLRQALRSFQRQSSSAGGFVRQFARQRAGVAGLLVILFMIGLSVYTMLALPAGDAFVRWRNTFGWEHNPRNALPAWVNWFRRETLPGTSILLWDDPAVTRERVEIGQDMWQVTLRYPFTYTADAFPQDVTIYLYADYEHKVPLISMAWQTPDGRTVDLGGQTLASVETLYIVAQQQKLQQRFGVNNPTEYLFTHPDAETRVPLQGDYELIISGYVFEPEADLRADLYVYGRVSGLAGTDYRRRDLLIPLLWGTPVALAFGLLAALGTSLLSLVFAALSAWHGGWVDWTIQRLTEINMVLPFLPVCMMVFVLYSRTIWALLGTAVALGIFGNAVLVYRSIFLQVREAGYVEAARAYGASDGRIILRYLMPRVLPTLIPQLIILVPTFVFFEAMLGAMGMSDPLVPTWGMLLRETLVDGLAGTPPVQLMAPLTLLLLLGVSFAMVGVALNRLLNPHLRETP